MQISFFSEMTKAKNFFIKVFRLYISKLICCIVTSFDIIVGVMLVTNAPVRCEKFSWCI
jgi:hypothetical protein